MNELPWYVRAASGTDLKPQKRARSMVKARRCCWEYVSRLLCCDAEHDVTMKLENQEKHAWGGPTNRQNVRNMAES